MNKLARYIIIAVSVAIVAFLIWYFSNIVWYIVVSAVLSLIGKPLVRLICRVKIRGKRLPTWLGATVSLVTMFTIAGLFFYSMIPLLASQFDSLQSIDLNAFATNFAEPLNRLDATISKYLPANLKDFSIQVEIVDQLNGLFNAAFFTKIFSSTATFLTEFFIFIFSVAFITFFFLKDEQLMANGFSLFFPPRYQEPLQRALSRIETLLRRYFVGLLIQSAIIMVLTIIGLLILRLPFTTSVVIAFFSGILNVIPYVGAVFALAISLVIPMAMYMNGGAPMPLDTLLLLITVVFLIIRAFDNFFFQPYIYASSANAHPLEIFIVLLIAGSLSGMLGMLLAVPVYTVARVFAKEFFNNLPMVQRLTKNM